MGRSYSEGTVKRFELLKARGIDCQSHPGLCLNKARIIQTLKLESGDIVKIRSCKKHYSSEYANAIVIKEEEV